MNKREFAAALPLQPRSILVIDPDEHTPGAAYAETHEGAPCFVWGGNASGAALADPDSVRRGLELLAPDVVIIEAALRSGGPWASSMHGQNIVRGGWVWMCRLAGIRVVMATPESWQKMPEIRTYRGADNKARYRAYAKARAGYARGNEDADASLCMMDYTFRALGKTRPTTIFYGRVPLTEPAGK